MKITIMFSLLALMVTACGKDSGTSAAAATASKELFSVWTRSSDGFVLDLDGGRFGLGNSYSALYTGGEICDCQFSVLGTQSAGNWTLASCSYRASTGSGSDPGCSSNNSNGKYTNDAAILKVCQGWSCATYN